MSLGLVLALAGCGELPQPFRHSGNDNPLARPDFSQETSPDAEQPVHRLTVTLKDFVDFPGDGNVSLKRALKGALERRGILVVTQEGDASVSPHASIKPKSQSQMSLDLAWDVATSDGHFLGQAKQQGVAEKVQIESHWDSLARDIAEGSADGIVQILRSTFTKGP